MPVGVFMPNPRAVVHVAIRACCRAVPPRYRTDVVGAKDGELWDAVGLELGQPHRHGGVVAVPVAVFGVGDHQTAGFLAGDCGLNDNANA